LQAALRQILQISYRLRHSLSPLIGSRGQCDIAYQLHRIPINPRLAQPALTDVYASYFDQIAIVQ